MKRLAIYEHYDPKNQVKRYVRHALEQLHRDCASLVFVSTAKLGVAERCGSARAIITEDPA